MTEFSTTVEFGGARFVFPSVLAAARRVTAQTVRKAIADGGLPARRELGRWLIPLAAAAAYQPRPRGGRRAGAGRPRKGRGG